MSSRQKILEEIHPLALIQEVQQRPALYSRDNAEVASAHHKHRIWADVAQSLFPDWDLCSARTREDRGLMKKWRNLRDTFKRQLEVQKKIREGASIKKKQYVYFKHMSFLLPHMGDDDCEGSSSPASQTSASNPCDLVWQPSSSKRSRTEGPSFFGANDFGEIDEDKHFLMSLIPSFKRMNEDEKLTAKMEILKVIKSVKENSTASALELSYEQLVPARALVDVKLETLGQAIEDSDSTE
ncbi:uncharacterized protein LOC128678083 isoform X2 [Plodia interpunctella]|uniref:uncharacterized protein LOC128678083 isoform X2 n=1 Tax=Plodia interpunctella TaxID=58824 RepID=UPI002367727B|nr:uncharacterized protein LOC128678083 isoform X2 [Plodia interpunctella]